MGLSGFGVGLIQAPAKRLKDHFAHGQAAVTGVEALDNGPRRLRRAGVADDAFMHPAELVVELEVLPVARGHTPAGVRIFLQRLQALFLAVLGQVHPELQNQRPFCHQHGLQALGAFQALRQVGCIGAALHAVENRPGVPGAQKHADPALGWQRSPEAPHHRAGEFLIRRFAHAVGLDKARVHPFVKQVDGLATSGAVDAAHQNNDRELGQSGQIHLCFEQVLAQLGHLRLVTGFVNGVAEFSGFKHERPIS